MGSMKRLFLALGLTLALVALAAPPAYPENALGAGYAHPAQGLVAIAAGLPFSPLGLDTGAALELAAGAAGVRGNLDLGLLVFPGLTVGRAYADLGGYLRFPFAYAGGGLGLGLALGPRASLELDAGVPLSLSATLGLGVGPGVFLDYAAGLRAYLEPVALDLGYDRTLGLYAELLYLF